MKHFRITTLALLFFVPSLVLAAEIPPAAAQAAREYLQKGLANDEQLGVVLLGLRATSDKELQPLYNALMHSSDRQTRLTAVAMTGEVGDENLNEALRERLANDPAMAVRSEALLQLLRREAITTSKLQEALKIEDDGIRMLAARALIQRGKGDQAIPPLQQLLRSRDPQVVAQARMSLFGLGVDVQANKEELRKIIVDPNTTDDVLLLLLGQIRREKIKSAAEVARYLTKPNFSREIRVQAYMALADVLPDASKTLRDAIVAPDESDLFRINLTRILFEQPDVKYFMDDLTKRDDLAGAVARFEQARLQGGQAISQTLTVLVVDLGHPVLLEYAMNRFRGDVEKDKKKAEYYVQPMLDVLSHADLNEEVMTAQHDRMATIVEWLANLGSPEAMKGLQAILAGSNDSIRKLTAGALYRSTNPGVCELVSPLRTSPYTDIRIYAALTLARHGRAEAIPVLLDIQAHAENHRPDVLTLVSWYLLKLSGQSQSAVDELAKTVR